MAEKGKDKSKEKKKGLEQKDIENLAKKIGYRILEDANDLCAKMEKYKVSASKLCIARHLCEVGYHDFSCDPWFEAFECTVEMEKFDCGVNGKKFSCKGGWNDDFECEKKFVCGSSCGAFNCLKSFDDEDCEDEFDCDEDHFSCNTKSEFNTASEKRRK